MESCLNAFILVKYVQNRWSSKYKAKLFVYGEANGVIWDMAVNDSIPFNKLFVVGVFDSETKLSQMQLCSAAEFDGLTFGKVFRFEFVVVFLCHCCILRLGKASVLVGSILPYH
jgi:hypothetical protein